MSTQNLNKKKTIIISIAAVALTACITTAAILLTSRTSAEEADTITEAETISETETYTIKPIPHTTKKQEEPKEITEITQETDIREPETVTFAPETNPENIIINDEADAALLEKYSEYISGEPNYISGEEIIETLSTEDTQATETPATTAATTTAPPEEIDWGGIVDDGFVLGGGWGDHLGQGGGEIGDTGGEPIVVIGC